jgi:uncharacterized small protein (DUF1192 family)
MGPIFFPVVAACAKINRTCSKAKERAMAIDLDELAPRKPKPQAVFGEDLSQMSVHELESRIAALEAEIVRSRDALRSRAATKNAADAFFKR